MPNEVTALGLTTATQAELLAEYTAALQTIFGDDINLDSNTPDGQLINIFIQSVLDQEDLATQVYNSIDPDNAIGNVLDQRVSINGIQRQAGTYTTTNVTIVTSQGVNLYGIDQVDQAVFTVADNAGHNWLLETTQLGLPSGTNVLLFRAEEPGQVLTTIGTITVPVTIVLGVVSINNPTTYSTLGINEETDAQLRIRRQKSVSLRAQGYLQGLLAALENINGIVSVNIYENTSSSTDIHGIPGHSIWVIVAGSPNIALSTAYNSTTVYQYGSIASSGGVNYFSVSNDNLNNLVTDTNFWQLYNPIAQTIYNYRNAGCGTFGSESYAVHQIDGTFFTIFWDFVVQEDVYIKFTAYSLNGTTIPNIQGIKDYLVLNFDPGVNEEVNINGLSTLVQQADSNVLVINSGFSTDPSGPFTNTLSPTNLNKQLVVIAPNIIVLPVILSCPDGSPVITSGLVADFTITVSDGDTIQYSAIGGFGAYIYSILSGTGSIAFDGLYTSNGAGIDVVQAIDDLGNIAISTVTVL